MSANGREKNGENVKVKERKMNKGKSD